MRGKAAAGVLALATVLTGCSGPTEAEYQAAISDFRALPDEAKAYACAADWYAVRFGVEGFVIVEECPDGTGAPITQSRALSASFERGEQEYAAAYYAQNPPDSGLLRRVDGQLLCGQTDEEIVAGIEQWREQTTFPSWDGVEYVPSVELETARLEIWREVACPLLEG
jgi:hypothetical protein